MTWDKFFLELFDEYVFTYLLRKKRKIIIY